MALDKFFVLFYIGTLVVFTSGTDLKIYFEQEVLADLTQNQKCTYLEEQCSNYEPFVLFDGDCATPSNLSELEKVLSEISSINSIGFLIWLEKLPEKQEVVSLVNIFDVSGTSRHLVEKLFQYYELQRVLSRDKQLIRSLEDGTFMRKISEFTEEEFDSYAISRSVLKDTLNQTTEISRNEATDLIDFAMNMKDLIEGIQEGDWKSVGIASAMLFSQAIDVISGLKFLKISKMFGKYAGPVVSVVTDLVSIGFDIAAFVNGNMNTLQTVITTISLVGSVISIALTIGAIFFPPLAIVGAIVSLLSALVTSILENMNENNLANLAVRKLDAYLILTPSEREYAEEYFKEHGEMPPDLAEQAEQSGLNVGIAGAYLDYLYNNNTSHKFRRIVIPAIEGTSNDDEPMFYKNSHVDLAKKSTFYFAKYAPIIHYFVDYGNSYYLQNQHFCETADSSAPGHLQTTSYKCERAIGVIAYTPVWRGDLTLINLMDGNDDAYGLHYSPNLFLVDEGKKTYVGGYMNDTFYINSAKVTGTLDGGFDANNTLVFDNDVPGSLKIDLNDQKLQFSTSEVELKNFKVILGRKEKSDTIVLRCDSIYVNGGENGKDIIEIPPNQQCLYNTFITMKPDLSIFNNGYGGTFFYQYTHDDICSNVNLRISESKATHYILYDDDIHFFRNVTFENGLITVTTRTPVGSTATCSSLVASVAEVDPSSGFYEPTISLHKVTEQGKYITIKVDTTGIVNTIYSISKPFNSTSRDYNYIESPPFGKGVFLISADMTGISGQGGDDVFLMVNTSYTQIIKGNLGRNTVIFQQNFYPSETIEIILDEKDGSSFTCSSQGKQTTMLDIQQVEGRMMDQELITVGCGDDFYVSGNGGTLRKEDKIEIRTGNCGANRSAVVRLSNHTFCINEAITGNFMYVTDFVENLNINLKFSVLSNHTFQFLFNLSVIENAIYDDVTTTLILYGKEGTLEIPISFNEGDEDMYSNNPTIVTNDSSIIKIKNDDNSLVVISNLTELFGNSYTGADFTNNFIFVDGWYENINGGRYNDNFMLKNNAKFSILDGGPGDDSLVFDEEYKQGETIEIDFVSNYITTIGPAETLNLRSIESVLGRTNETEIVRITCAQSDVDLRGGTEYQPDRITILSGDGCEPENSTKMIIWPNTEIENFANSGKYTYILDEAAVNQTIGIFTGFVDQTIVLPIKRYQLDELIFEDSNHLMHMKFNINYTSNFLKVNLIFNETDEDITSNHVQPRILTSDITEVLVNKNGSFTLRIFVNDDEIYGFPDYKNEFILSNCTFENVNGGKLDDTFIITNGSVTGLIDGKEGSNLIVLADFNGTYQVTPLEYDKFFGVSFGISYNSISGVLGRKGETDKLIITPDIYFVNLNGGNFEGLDPDIIYIPKLSSNQTSYDVRIVLNDFTLVENYANNGSFSFLVKNSTDNDDQPIPGSYQIQCHNCSYGLSQHSFILGYSSEIVKNVDRNNITCDVFLHHDNRDVSSFGLKGTFEECYFPSLIFSDGLLLEVSRIGVKRVSHSTNKTDVKEALKFYRETYVNRWNASTTVMLNDTILLSIGRETFDTMLSSPLHESHLFGNGGQNVYIISAKDTSSAGENIADVYIYCSPANLDNSTFELVEMSQLITPIRQKNFRKGKEPQNKLYLPTLELNDNDSLTMVIEDLGRKVAAIHLIDWRDSEIIFMMGANMLVLNTTEEDTWFLSPLPVEFTNETFLVADLADFEDETEIKIDKSFPLNETSSILKGNGSDIIITNLLDSNDETRVMVQEEGTFTLVLKDLGGIKTKYQNRAIPSGVKLSFGNGIDIQIDTIKENYNDYAELSIVEDENRKVVLEEIFEFQCLEEGLSLNPKDCGTYYRCFFNPSSDELKGILLPCPGDTIFCIESQSCAKKSETCSCKPAQPAVLPASV